MIEKDTKNNSEPLHMKPREKLEFKRSNVTQAAFMSLCWCFTEKQNYFPL